MKKKVIAVVSATRAPGRGLIRAMLDDVSGEFVPRAVVKDVDNEEVRFLAAQGVEVVEGRVGLEASLRAAFAGAHGAFYIMLPDEQSLPERKIGEANTLARAAKAAGLQHVVWANLEDASAPQDDAGEELTPALSPESQESRKIDVKAETSKVFTNLGVPTTFLQASWHSQAVTGKWAEELGKCAYGIFRSPELRNKTVSIDEAQLALELAKAAAPAPAPPPPRAPAINELAALKPRRNLRPLIVGGSAAAVALVLILVLALGHRSDPEKSGEIARATASTPESVGHEPPAPSPVAAKRTPPPPPAPPPTPPPVVVKIAAPAPPPAPPPVIVAKSVAPAPAPAPAGPKIIALNSQGMHTPPALPSARPVPEPSNQIAMHSAPVSPANRNRGYPKRMVGPRKKGRADEEPRSIPSEPAAPVRTTTVAEVRRQPEVRPSEPEAAPPEPEASRPVERLRETKAAVALPRPAPSTTTSPPTLEAPPPGTVDKSSVAATVRAHRTEVFACFERARMDNASLHGKFEVTATIDPTGHVISVSPVNSIEGGARLQTCVLSAFKEWVFSAPSGGVKGRISYRFSFE